MRRVSLRVKLTMAFIIFAVILIGIVTVFANFVMKKQFESYTVNKLDKSVQDMLSEVEGRFTNVENRNAEAIEDIGVRALGEGLMLRVKNEAGTVLWDAWEHNNGFCTEMLQHIAMNMTSYDSNFQGSYQEEAYPVLVDGQPVGSIEVGYYGPYFYSETDIQYLEDLNKFLLITGGGSLLLCLFLGALIARRLTQPIASVIAAAGRIAKGDLGSRITEKSTTSEIADLTDSINSMAQELSEQEQLRKRLTADVAHELRTPLATLQSHMEAMIDGIWEAEPKRLISCHEEILRMTKLVGELQTLSQYDSETLTLQKERMDVSELVRRVAKNFENEFQTKDISLDFSGSEAWVAADKDKISQVLVNLISNALNYTPSGARVTISTDTTADEISITVSDTGIGISDSDLPYIFERFYRTDKSRNRATGGSGIGLTIAKNIITAHGGRMEVHSQVNRGSSFTFYLPKQS